MTRNDLILIAVLIIFSITPIAMNSNSDKKIAVLKVDGVIVRELDLTTEKTFAVKSGGGKNIVEIKNGAIRVIEADCPDKICVRRGAIKNPCEIIACVPHKVLIEVLSD